jgi:hypothetical protein
MFVSPLHYHDTFMKDIMCLELYMIYIIAMKHICDSKTITLFWLQMFHIKSMYDMHKIMYTYWSLMLCPCYIVLQNLMF